MTNPTREGDPGAAPEWVVLKFGGTSVSSLERWRTIAELLDERLAAGHRPVVVCSALSQVSNRLERLLEAADGSRDVGPGLDELRRLHTALASAMELDADRLLGDLFADLRRLLEGVRLTGEVTPRLRARVLSAGELLSTRLGAAWLRRCGTQVAWQDARDLLEARTEPRASPERQYLSATCDQAFDPSLEARLRALPEPVILTQGFVARLPGGDTVLLGRGGSDTAAAYVAAKLGAARLEIWTDVPGMFTTNPRSVPGARLLLHLSHAEAGELASKGAQVLHPRSIRALQEQAIPIHVRCTPAPELPGTVISSPAPGGPAVRAVSARRGIVLVSMEVEGDWQGIGVIADITARFKVHGLSIDQLASSPTNLTVALDPRANDLGDETLDPLLEDLRQLCVPRLIRPAASVSLVGSGIRAVLHQWAGVLELFEDEKVYLVAQAANDLSLTLVVDESSAERLV
ncbi:MAG TPA: aspartate kinase, partial [Thermoanaerobaculia bacterium]|nr:aspartate kinase [Thermoanaerobaculia bacterium]